MGARLLVALIWLLGKMFLLRLARISSRPGALVTVAIYLLLPFGIVVGRSFQPDPVMVAMLLGACLAAVRYGEQPTAARFRVASGGCSRRFIRQAWMESFLPVAALLLRHR